MADVARPLTTRLVDIYDTTTDTIVQKFEGRPTLEWADFFEQIEQDNALHKLKPYTVAQLQAMDAAGTISGYPLVICTNESGGPVPVFWDGVGDWRRVTDRAVIS